MESYFLIAVSQTKNGVVGRGFLLDGKIPYLDPKHTFKGTNKVLLLLNEHGDPSFLFQNLSSYNINRINRQSFTKISVQVLFSGLTLNRAC